MRWGKIHWAFDKGTKILKDWHNLVTCGLDYNYMQFTKSQF